MKLIENVTEALLDLEGKEMKADPAGKETFTYKVAFLRLLGNAQGKDGNENVEILEMGRALGAGKPDWLIEEARNHQGILERLLAENKVGEGRFPGYISGAMLKKVSEATAFKK